MRFVYILRAVACFSVKMSNCKRSCKDMILESELYKAELCILKITQMVEFGELFSVLKFFFVFFVIMFYCWNIQREGNVTENSFSVVFVFVFVCFLLIKLNNY